MKPDGVAAFFGPGLNDGPFPEHYEPLESPLQQNLMSAQHNSPIITTFKSDMDKVASADPKYPLVLTTYSATEHWCSGTMSRWQAWLTEAMPQVYVEMSEELAAERSLKNGEWVTVSSARGSLDAVAMVTPRLQPLMVGGKMTHTVGMPYNYGWLYPKDNGDTCNLLTVFVGDGNAGTPEYKACMVNIRKKA
jgi:formate dehydrogenase major subunit